MSRKNVSLDTFTLIENVNSACVWNLRIQIQMWNSFVQRTGIMFFKEGVGETH